jgi:ABC-type Zn2+ transport system substrate-binding protein/surface adhesin
MGMILTPTMLTAMLRRDDVDLCYIQQALATVWAQRGDEADTFLDKILASVPKKRAAVVRTLAAQVRGERLANPQVMDGRRR